MRKFSKKERRIQQVVNNNPAPQEANMIRIRELLGQMGTNIKLARLRRRVRARNVCLKAAISRTTLWNVEKGSPGVGIGIYAQILFILGLENEIAKWGADDIVGQKIRDEELRLQNFGNWRRKKLGLENQQVR